MKQALILSCPWRSLDKAAELNVEAEGRTERIRIQIQSKWSHNVTLPY